MKINFDLYLTEEIHQMIANRTVTNQSVIDFYGNEWWDDKHE